ncbi:hypothetical protein ACYFX5_09100 [Bremerella sp. T1]|uniref:hypothetical protein n=1 Tax=Bremerella sp. TYQ1 TaxID=3119568 RepID=UPI001CCE3F26|nr:hypothetical protein [Bremerella volcania]UBM38409.1 hypothetical protein LA756_11035 [Bremerella volcania]
MARLAKSTVRSIVMHALEKFGKSQADRSELCGGDKFDLDLVVSGKIGNQKVEEACHGTLSVGHDGTRNSSNGIAPAKLVAFLVNANPKTAKKRAEQLREFAKNGKIGEKITADQEAQADGLIKLFNQTVSNPVKGSVSFSVAKAAA